MSGIMRFEFRLFGPRKGQTVLLNNHPFIDGVCVLMQSSENMGNAARVFSFYRAFARGTPEYDEALALEEAENGTGKVDTKTIERTNPTVSSGVQSDGGGSSEGEADASVIDVKPDRPDTTSISTNGDGHEYAGVPKFPEDANYRAEEPASQVDTDVAAAVKKLDPSVDEHWVMTGAHKDKPKLQAVEEAYGKANLTRQDVDAAAPGYDRHVALDIVLSA